MMLPAFIHNEAAYGEELRQAPLPSSQHAHAEACAHAAAAA